MLFGLALFVCSGRVLLRAMAHTRLLLDDYILLFALATLSASTAIIYKVAPTYFLTQALVRNDPIARAIAVHRLPELTSHFNWTFSTIVLSWTTVFAVKASYLALFWPMMSVMKKSVVWLYWATVGFCAISWAIVAFGSNFLLCPYVGAAAGMLRLIWLHSSRS